MYTFCPGNEDALFRAKMAFVLEMQRLQILAATVLVKL